MVSNDSNNNIDNSNSKFVMIPYLISIWILKQKKTFEKDKNLVQDYKYFFEMVAG